MPAFNRPSCGALCLERKTTYSTNCTTMSLFRRAVSAVRIAPSSGSRQVVSKRTSVQCLNYSCTQVRTFRFSSYVSAEGDPDEVKRCTTEVGKPSARILRIADDVLALDLLEINQLLRNVQVGCHLTFHADCTWAAHINVFLCSFRRTEKT